MTWRQAISHVWHGFKWGLVLVGIPLVILAVATH